MLKQRVDSNLHFCFVVVVVMQGKWNKQSSQKGQQEKTEPLLPWQMLRKPGAQGPTSAP